MRHPADDAPLPAPTPRAPQPGGVRVLLRGLRRRCPRCGARGLFDGLLRIKARCPRCAFRLEREEGGFLGAMTVNFAIVTTMWLIALVAWLIVDLPDLQVLPFTLGSLALMGIAPLVCWGHSKTIWASVDYLVYRSDPSYASREAADRASGNGGPH